MNNIQLEIDQIVEELASFEIKGNVKPPVTVYEEGYADGVSETVAFAIKRLRELSEVTAGVYPVSESADLSQ